MSRLGSSGSSGPTGGHLRQAGVVGVATVQPLTGDLWPALVDLFGRGGASNGCWCMYWVLGPDYRRRQRDQNREALHHAIQETPTPGLLALDENDRALGWCRVSPRAELGWLNRRRDLAPVDGLPVWSVPCFYVRRGSRRQGVMKALIDAAVDYAKKSGAAALEAYPIDTSAPGATRNIFPGTAAAFQEAGFTVVARRAADRPIMRHYLGRPA